MANCVKKTVSLLLTLAVLAVMTLSCGAVDVSAPKAVLEDYQHVLSSDDEAELLDLMQQTAREIDMNIGIIIADDLGSIKEVEYCETFAEAYFGLKTNSLVLLLTEEGSGDTDWVYTTGKAEKAFEPQLEKIFDAVYYGWNSGNSPNYKAASEQFCRYLAENAGGYSGVQPGDYSGISYMAFLDDYQYALSESEKQEILAVIQSTADEIGANVGVVLSDSLNGKSESRYTDDYLDDHFGAESSSIVLMLVKEGSGNQDWISCTKDAYDIYYSRIDRIFDDVYYGLDKSPSPNYPAAIREFCSYLENHQGEYAVSSGYSGSFHFGFGHLVALIFALVIALSVTGAHAAGYKKKAPISARQYLDKSRTNFTLRQDIFVREYNTSHRISSSSGGHHGGGGGRSHSGGRGGGGGRHR